MQSVANLATFAELGKSWPDTLYYRTHENPTAIQVKGLIDKTPNSWEHIAFDAEGCPNSEENLNLQKGSYLILFSSSANTAMFYRVKGGEEGRPAAQHPFKMALTIAEHYKAQTDNLQQRLDESHAIQIKLASKLHKAKRGKKRAKKKLKETAQSQLADLIELVITTIFKNLNIKIEQDPPSEPRDATSREPQVMEGDFYDDNDCH